MRFVILLSLLSCASAHAQEISFRILGVREEILFERSVVLEKETLGRVTNKILEQAVIARQLNEYKGTDSGVLGINGLGSALELLSDTQMNAYGWCYRIDGKVLDLLADQYMLTGQETRIEWFYAYAYFEKDQWKTMCIPADHKPEQEI